MVQAVGLPRPVVGPTAVDFGLRAADALDDGAATGGPCVFFGDKVGAPRASAASLAGCKVDADVDSLDSPAAAMVGRDRDAASR